MEKKEKETSFNWELSIAIFMLLQLQRFETRSDPFTNFDFFDILITLGICYVIGNVFKYYK